MRVEIQVSDVHALRGAQIDSFIRVIGGERVTLIGQAPPNSPDSHKKPKPNDEAKEYGNDFF